MKTIVHVARNQIAANAKNGTNLPALIVRRGGKATRHHTVKILGPSEMVYSPHKPLACGARCWLETTSELELA